jgi:hypothetical protein
MGIGAVGVTSSLSLSISSSPITDSWSNVTGCILAADNRAFFFSLSERSLVRENFIAEDGSDGMTTLEVADPSELSLSVSLEMLALVLETTDDSDSDPDAAPSSSLSSSSSELDSSEGSVSMIASDTLKPESEPGRRDFCIARRWIGGKLYVSGTVVGLSIGVSGGVRTVCEGPGACSEPEKSAFSFSFKS